jgi:DNA repair exonuclease SbcCD ATPase subunit
LKREEADRALRRATNLAAQLQGRRDTLGTRRQEIADGVALAKARGQARPELDEILDELQAELSERTVSLYSGILTQLVKDVKLPKSRDVSIELRLRTDRGLPALDIVAVRNGNAVNIMDKAGGALTNIVCLGLRSIATICNKKLAPFLVLDEADCWVKPDATLVQNFYSMVGGLAAQLNLQALVISHHDAGLFARDGINLLKVDGDPEAGEGVSVEARKDAPAWPSEDVPGLRWIRLRNFASFNDATFPLSPGVNVIHGDNDLGKSRPMAALRAVAYDMGDDGDIRHGKDRCDVDIGLPRGRVLSWSRKPKRNPINLWRLTDPNGEVTILEDGTRCETGGKDGLPKWVPGVLGIARVDGLDVQLVHQKTPVFLLNEPPSRRAMILSVGGEVSAVRDMIAASKEDKKADAAVIKQGEQEVARLMERLGELESLEGLKAALEALDAQSGAVATAERDAAEAGEFLEAIEKAVTGLAVATLVADAAADVEEPDVRALIDRIRDAETDGIALSRVRSSMRQAEDAFEACTGLPDEPPAVPRTDEAAEDGERLASAATLLAETRAILDATAKLPDEAPPLPATDDAEDAGERLGAASAELGRALAVLAATDALPNDTPEAPRTDAADADGLALADTVERLAKAARDATEARDAESEVALELSDALAGMGNLCPTCGTPGITHEHILAAGD